jgi:hypothetical protein
MRSSVPHLRRSNGRAIAARRQSRVASCHSAEALDLFAGRHHPLLLTTGAAIGRRRIARETAEVPVVARAHRGDKLQPWLAVFFAALLAIAPFTRPSLSVDLAAVPAASIEALVAHDDGQGKQPATGLRPAQASNLGILSRLSLLETTLELPPVKSPLLRPAPDQPVLAAGATTTFGGEPRQTFQRSSVGTARTPTGPPS